LRYCSQPEDHEWHHDKGGQHDKVSASDTRLLRDPSTGRLMAKPRDLDAGYPTAFFIAKEARI
jgi:hypothetical protein